MPTFKPLWSDGIHYVRPASAKDRHTMRFYVGAHKVTDSRFQRHAPTEEDAIGHAREATRRWLSEHPADAAYVAQPSGSQPIADSATPKPTAPRDLKKKKVEEMPFSTHCFDCILANPYAQVWQCSALVNERKPVGRPKADGSAPVQAPVIHEPGECALMFGDKVYRDPDGRPRVYGNWAEADEAAQHLYREALERDEAISWKEGDTRVGATEHVDILFDPDTYGAKKPFILWLPDYGRPVYEDRTVSTIKARPPSKGAIERNPQLKIDYDASLARARELEVRAPSFEERPLQFRSIWEATKEAERREKMLRGEYVK